MSFWQPILLLISLCIAAPPAFASLTTSSGQRFQARFTPRITPDADRFTSRLPSSLAAHAVISAHRAHATGLLGALGGLAGELALLLGGAPL